jgi:radical SAM enzyme (TIGR01210 family)
MCDLWRQSTTSPTPPGAIPRQISGALEQLPAAEAIKLYNGGSFFDRAAIPPSDHPIIAEQCRRFGLVVVESHPALVGDPVLRFRDRLHGHLEVAMGLETVHPRVLLQLNKRMTVELFERAAHFLRSAGVGLRVFVLVRPPFVAEAEGLEWAIRSVEVAQQCGATVVVLIPTRPGNGAIEALQVSGEYSLPRLETLEQALACGIELGRGRVFADLWDLRQFSRCPACYSERLARLRQMNLQQEVSAPITCERCGSG